jgi:hypothetical protein
MEQELFRAFQLLNHLIFKAFCHFFSFLLAQQIKIQLLVADGIDLP